MPTNNTYHPKNFTAPNNNTLARDEKRLSSPGPYVFNDNINIAVDIALATQRPLLVAGDPGSGKSRLAEAMAAVLQWNYLSYTMTSRTRLEDLTADFDHLKRMNDAQSGEVKEDWVYFRPGLFWWAFNPSKAAKRGGSEYKAKKYNIHVNYPGIEAQNQTSPNAVLLIDEIDKAEPDLPNDLLEPLDRKQFTLPDGSWLEADQNIKLLTIITTNRERELPSAFMRRCVTLTLDAPDAEKLKTIAKEHFKQHVTGSNMTRFSKMVSDLADITIDLQNHAKQRNIRPPSTSEFIDAIRTCNELGIDSKHELWETFQQSLLIKNLQN